MAPRDPVGCLIQLIVGLCGVSRLNGNPIRELTDLLEPLRYRLLDLFLVELNERTRRVETLRPNRLLLRGSFAACVKRSLMV
jgi:hypothetical protein